MFVRSIQDITPYLPQNVSVDFNRIKPYIDNEAEPRFLQYWLGDDFYDALDTKITNNTLTPLETKLVSRARYAVANYAYYFGLPANELQFGNAGITRSDTDTHKTAYGRQIERLRQMLAEAAHSGIEQMLKILEANKATFTVWANSPQCTLSNGLFLNSATEFNRFYSILSSSRTFASIRHIIQQVEFNVTNIIDQPLFDELKTQIATATISVDNTKILTDFIRPAIAHLTIADACKELPLQITSNGLHLYLYSNGQDDGQLQPADKEALSILSAHCNQIAQRYIANLRNYLITNASTYPLFPLSNFITPTTDDFNKNTNSIYVF